MRPVIYLAPEKRRYSAPLIPLEEEGPPPDPVPVNKKHYTIRSAKPLGGGKFALFHFTPAKVESRRGFGVKGKSINYIWSYIHPPRIVDAQHLAKIGVDPSRDGPKLFSLVSPEVIEQLEGRLRSTKMPVRAAVPAGRERVGPPNTRFSR